MDTLEILNFWTTCLILTLSDKLDLRRGGKNVALSRLSIYYTSKNVKKAYIITTNLKYQHQHEMRILNYQIGHILYQIFNIILSIF